MRGPHHSSRDWSGFVFCCFCFYISRKGGKRRISPPKKTEKEKENPQPAKSNSCRASVFKRRWPKVEHAAKKKHQTPQLDVAEVLLFPSLSTSLRGRACRLAGCTEVCGITPGCGVRLRCRRDVSLVDHRGLHTLHTSSFF